MGRPVKLRVGIIGLGVGEAHIQGYNSHPECEVVALCDFSDEKLKVARDKYKNLKLSSDADEIIEDTEIDVVSIASYDNYHFEQIKKAIANDKHIFVEKPICLYEEEAIKAREFLDNKPHLKMSSNLILRKVPRFNLLKKKIENGDIGRLFYVEGDYNYGRLHKITQGWRGKIDFYSIVYGGGVHMIDLLLWLTNDKITEVSAYGTNIATKGTDFRYNDTVVSILKFESGMIGKMSANFSCVFPHFHSLSIYGTKATFVNGFENGSWFNSQGADLEHNRISEAYPGTHKGDLIYSFIESILQDTKAEVDKEDVFDSMSVCFAIEKAVKESKPVKVKYI